MSNGSIPTAAPTNQPAAFHVEHVRMDFGHDNPQLETHRSRFAGLLTSMAAAGYYLLYLVPVFAAPSAMNMRSVDVQLVAVFRHGPPAFSPTGTAPHAP